MPIQIQEIKVENETPECPLCMERLEVDDINFFPCVCGYQVCRFCWHRIRTDENGLCPACRTSYPEDPAEFRPLTGSDLQKIRHEKRQKEVQRRQKLTDGRRHLSAIRVLQKNLVFVIGLSQRLSDADVLKRQEYFGKYGKILKVVINSNTAYAGTQTPSSSAYVTYSKMEEALKAIQAVNNVYIDGRTLKASLGTTKYCSTYLKSQQCHKADCMYLHELADDESSFTKEDMQMGRHQELEQRLVDQMIRKESEALTSVEPVVSAEMEKPPTRARRHSGSVGPQPAVQPENSWVAGMSKDQGLSALLLSSLEEKTSKIKDAASRKAKKTALRSSNKPQAPSPLDSFPSDSGPASSDCSSLATTPPPPSNPSSTTDNRLTADSCGDITQEPEIPPTSTHSFQPEIYEQNKPETVKNEPKILDITQLSNETDSLLISKPQEPPQFHQPFQRFTEPSENYSSVTNGNFSLNYLLPQSVPDSSWTQQPLPETTPIKPSSYWETALGLSTNHTNTTTQFADASQTNDNGDDDLGFDPWLECSKGFADLIEKERTRNNLQHSSVDGWNNSHSQQQPQSPLHNHLLPGTFPSGYQDHQQAHYLGRKALAGFPSAFPSDSHQNLSFNSQINHLHGGRSFPTNNLSNNKPNSIQNPIEKIRDDWENGLRALLPSVNINFAMNNPSKEPSTTSNFPRSCVPGFGRPPLQNQDFGNREKAMFSLGYDDWNTDTQVPQTQSALFPTFLNSNTAPFHNSLGLNLANSDGYNSNSVFPGLSSSHYQSDPSIVPGDNRPSLQQTPTTEEPPHWMRSLQTLTESDSSMHLPTTSVFPLVANQPPVATLPSWPSKLPSATMPQISLPPPGFQSKYSFPNTSDFGMQHNLLENQS